jgi:MscS family membrane protein
MNRRVNRRTRTWWVVAICICCVSAAAAQVLPTATESKPEVPKDSLGRDTPRGTVLGFLAAARKGTSGVALYLDTPLRGPDADELARQLAVVLDARLPARLNQLSDKPEGSIPDPLKPDEDVVGTISTAKGELEVLVERVDRGKVGRVWLFSRKTLASIPEVYAELNSSPVEKYVPNFLLKRVAHVPLFHWLAFLVGLPALYLLTRLLDALIRLSFAIFGRKFLGKVPLTRRNILPAPVRLLIVAIVIRLVLPEAGLPLLARQFWSTTSLVITIIACIWLLILLNSWGERFLVSRRSTLSGSVAVLRLFRRVLDGLVLFAGLLFTLYYFGVNPTAAFAGLGVGGIAVALAAQKTLENLIAGISLVADRAVHVGDFLKIGDTFGTIEEVGLRSTRIRTPDRTVVSLPNGLISNMSLETLSARDKFWFHPLLNLRFETTISQIRLILSGVHNLLLSHSSVERSSVRVRFLAIAKSSLDVEIFSYIYANDWAQFLEIQEQLLFSIIELVEQAGAEFAFPSQTMYVSSDSMDKRPNTRPKLRADSGSTETASLKPSVVKH